MVDGQPPDSSETPVPRPAGDQQGSGGEQQRPGEGSPGAPDWQQRPGPQTPPRQPQQPPRGPTGPPRGSGPPPGVGTWLSEGWELFTSNVGNCILMVLVPLVPMGIAAVILLVSGVPGAIQGSFGGRSDAGAALAAGSVLIGSIVAMAFLLLVMPAVTVGVYACFWEMIQTRRLTFDKITSGLPLFLSALGMGILFQLMAMIAGGVLGVIPVIGQLAGIVIGLPLTIWVAFAFYEMAVNQRGAIDCMGEGWRLMMVDFWNLMLLALLVGLIYTAGVIACGIGLFVAIPVVFAALGCAYRDMRA